MKHPSQRRHRNRQDDIKDIKKRVGDLFSRIPAPHVHRMVRLMEKYAAEFEAGNTSDPYSFFTKRQAPPPSDTQPD